MHSQAQDSIHYLMSKSTSNFGIKSPKSNHLEEQLPAGYGTGEGAPNADFEPLHELLVELHPGFLLDLSAQAAEQTQWLLPLAAVGAVLVAIDSCVHFLGHVPADM